MHEPPCARDRASPPSVPWGGLAAGAGAWRLAGAGHAHPRHGAVVTMARGAPRLVSTAFAAPRPLAPRLPCASRAPHSGRFSPAPAAQRFVRHLIRVPSHEARRLQGVVFSPGQRGLGWWVPLCSQRGNAGNAGLHSGVTGFCLWRQRLRRLVTRLRFPASHDVRASVRAHAYPNAVTLLLFPYGEERGRENRGLRGCMAGNVAGTWRYLIQARECAA